MKYSLHLIYSIAVGPNNGINEVFRETKMLAKSEFQEVTTRSIKLFTSSDINTGVVGLF
jgi:hypothetical protein